MSLKEQLGKAVMKRIEAMPSVQAAKERFERISPAQRAAKDAAYSSLDDEAAKLALRDRINADPEVLKEATVDLAGRRDDFIADRAYRLLSATAAGAGSSRSRRSARSCSPRKSRSAGCLSSKLSSAWQRSSRAYSP